MLKMPEADPQTLKKRASIAAALRRIVPGEGVIETRTEMSVYESDGLTAYRQMPLVVVLPKTTAEVAKVLRYAFQNKIKVVPRGAGTSLSGGALPLADGIVLGLSKFNRILEIDYDNRCAVVQPGVTNLAITQAVQHKGFYYAPDPSSQIACTIGGNVAENSGGVHCLKYGLTANNILGLEMVLISGEVIRLGGKHLDSDGLDLLGVITGSEGLLGVITEVTVRLLQKPETARVILVGFPSSEDAGNCVADIISAGIIPGGMEMMDKPAIHAVEEFVHADYPLDVEALLIIELDGPAIEVDHLIEEVSAIARKNKCSTSRISTSEAERLLFWAGRKAAFPAVGRISPDYFCMDGTIPRKRLSEVLTGMAELSKKHGLRVANVFHAGDGNLHPLILYDANVADELARAEEFGADILRLCVKVGGVLTGEHGVGIEKRDLMPEMFTEADLAQQQRLKCAFDDRGLLNPGKVFPTLHRLRRAGPHACEGGQAALPGDSEILMTPTFKPQTVPELADYVALGGRLEVMGSGTKRGLGRPLQPETASTCRASPAFRSMSRRNWCLRPGPARRSARSRRRWPRTASNWPSSRRTIRNCSAANTRARWAGLMACGLSGPRRIKAGAARDHILGIAGVSGRGEIFKAGGRVVKNVTGYDVAKLMAGSYGTLAALTSITVKVLPAAATEETLVFNGLSDAKADPGHEPCHAVGLRGFGRGASSGNASRKPCFAWKASSPRLSIAARSLPAT